MYRNFSPPRKSAWQARPGFKNYVVLAKCGLFGSDGTIRSLEDKGVIVIFGVKRIIGSIDPLVLHGTNASNGSIVFFDSEGNDGTIKG